MGRRLAYRSISDQSHCQHEILFLALLVGPNKPTFSPSRLMITEILELARLAECTVIFRRLRNHFLQPNGRLFPFYIE